MLRKMQACSAVILVFVVTIGGYSLGFQNPNLDKSAQTLSDEATELMRKGDYQSAIAKADLAVKKDPGSSEAYKDLALAYCGVGREEEAIGPAQKAVSLAPELDRAHFVLGMALFGLKRMNESISQFQEAIRLNSKYDQAYYFIGRGYDFLNKLEEARLAFDQAARIQPDVAHYQRIRDSLITYIQHKKNDASLPAIVPGTGKRPDYANAVYSGVFYEALLHRDYDFIEKSANAARSSKEKLPGGLWKLQLIYSRLNEPEANQASERNWNDHISRLKEWTKEKPSSITAKVALAAGYVAYAWQSRGNGLANTVSEQGWRLFSERLDLAKETLLAASGSHRCPNWYSVMQKVALGQGWDTESYEKLFAEAVRYEPGWYEYYKQKAIFLLPRWRGQPGELEAFLKGFNRQPSVRDSAMIYFLVSEFAATYDDSYRYDLDLSYATLKEGYYELRKAYGVTPLDMNWMCFQALNYDRLFAREVFTEIKDNFSLRVWGSKAAFDAAKGFAEMK